MKFPYKKLYDGHVRPIIPIRVGYRNKHEGYFALVDSGADVCIFSAEIGEILGINVESGKKCLVGGITEGEKQFYYIHPIVIQVGGWPYNIEAGFMPTISRLGYGVLGQKGFFDLFVVKFDYTRGEIEIKESNLRR